ncbi:creatinine amidohydrolase [Geminocystis sp. NIES-3708]|uniref:creatininase family protein n=1 Tax=Geminocystis sp. NIES-3708 TaxID=1615909 RepID=UPI0005FCBB8B|nr:creatininase family protein [Geminocystis sp. NIES-3708]BAQ62862.1 creatinine amidohydrolase [Geminocystis sp. NIES-3708]
MQLHLCTWIEVETYLQHNNSIIIPIGSTEQHGPTGLIGTDAICAEKVALGVSNNVKTIVAPTINVGMALHHTAFPGTISLRPTTLIVYVQDYVTSLAKAGFRKFFFINGHGGNIATLKAAFSQIYDYLDCLNLVNSDQVKCKIANWFMGREVYLLAKKLYGEEEGSHATPSEVALTQFVYPDVIKNAVLGEQVGKGHPIYGASNFRGCYPDGRMGSNPALATPEHGQQFYELAVKELTESYLEFIS